VENLHKITQVECGTDRFTPLKGAGVAFRSFAEEISVSAAAVMDVEPVLLENGQDNARD
jgi:hypothetical protein